MAHTIHSHAMVAPGTIIAANKEGITVQAGQDAVCITELQLPVKTLNSIGITECPSTALCRWLPISLML